MRAEQDFSSNSKHLSDKELGESTMNASDKDFDSGIKAALEKECDGISASEELKRRIDETIRERQEDNSMKHMSVKKLCVGVAAACLLVSGITVFAGGAIYFVSGSPIEPEYTEYQDMEKAQKKLGYAVDCVEQFENGYTFAGVSIETIGAYSEESGKMYSIPAMDVTYRKEEMKIDLNISEKAEDGLASKQPVATRMCGDTMLRYDEYTNKTVPASYELTEEDKINEQRDDYNIIYRSVTVKQTEQDSEEAGVIGTEETALNETESEDVKRGSYVVSEDGVVTATIQDTQADIDYTVTYDEVSIQHQMIVSWEKDGKFYSLMGTDLDLSADEMMDMAEEILHNFSKTLDK